MSQRKRFWLTVLGTAAGVLLLAGLYLGVSASRFQAAVREIRERGTRVQLQPQWIAEYSFFNDLQERVGLSDLALSEEYDSQPREMADIRPAFRRLAKHVLELCSPLTHVTDDDAREIGAATRLRILAVNAEGLTDAGLDAVSACRQLTHLGLLESQISDAGLTSLRPLTKLTRLSLSGSQATSAGLPVLASLPSLNSLDLSRTLVDDTCAPILKTMGRLREIDLSHTLVGDDACEVLSRLPGIDTVNIVRTRVTRHGIDTLLKRKPGLSIRYDGQFPDAAD